MLAFLDPGRYLGSFLGDLNRVFRLELAVYGAFSLCESLKISLCAKSLRQQGLVSLSLCLYARLRYHSAARLRASDGYIADTEDTRQAAVEPVLVGILSPVEPLQPSGGACGARCSGRYPSGLFLRTLSG